MSVPPIAILVLKTMKNRMPPHEYNSVMRKIQAHNYSDWIEQAPDTLRKVKENFFTSEDLFTLGIEAASTGRSSMPREDIYRWIKELADSGKDMNLIDIVGNAQAATINSQSVINTINIFDSFEKFTASVETPHNVDDGPLNSAWDFLTETIRDTKESVQDIDADKVSEASAQIIKWFFGVS